MVVLVIVFVPEVEVVVVVNGASVIVPDVDTVVRGSIVAVPDVDTVVNG